MKFKVNGHEFSAYASNGYFTWTDGYWKGLYYVEECEAQQAAIDFWQKTEREEEEIRLREEERKYGTYEQQKYKTYRSLIE